MSDGRGSFECEILEVCIDGLTPACHASLGGHVSLHPGFRLFLLFILPPTATSDQERGPFGELEGLPPPFNQLERPFFFSVPRDF